MTTERDPGTRIVLSWLREDSHENAERVLLRALDEIDTTPRRRSWWPAWRTNRMPTYAKLIAAAAAVLAVAVVGYNLLPGLGILGPGATPSPSQVLLARGTFVDRDWGPVEFVATREGSIVTGRITLGAAEGTTADPSRGFLSVDPRCARTTEDGLIMIGGSVTHGAGERISYYPAGTNAAIVLRRGPPLGAGAWAGAFDYAPGTEATDCLAYLDAWLTWERKNVAPGVGWPPTINGTVELGP